eukprot:TRINITY_DN7558_c0_g1_i3.p1 TRINITY_DN7558_c0_g1~~TRINITY_DN7558_c0_g1_i3.p1  ORF type:complete len:467 (+),score=66.79 TRINITY_DN7558_c0_g1_i3:123-1523(+)
MFKRKSRLRSSLNAKIDLAALDSSATLSEHIAIDIDNRNASDTTLQPQNDGLQAGHDQVTSKIRTSQDRDGHPTTVPAVVPSMKAAFSMPMLARGETITSARQRRWRQATLFLASVGLHGSHNRIPRTLSGATESNGSRDDIFSMSNDLDVALDIQQVSDMREIPLKNSLLLGSRLIFAAPSHVPIVTSTLLEPQKARKRRFAGLELPNPRAIVSSASQPTTQDAKIPTKLEHKGKGTHSYRKELDTDISLDQLPRLDDQGLHHGRHQKVIVLPSYRVSLTQHVEPSLLKKELNARFKERYSEQCCVCEVLSCCLARYPSIELSLSKLRSLKQDMVEIGKIVRKTCSAPSAVHSCLYFVQCLLNLSTVAMAQLHYDRVVMAELVTKDTRKLLAACCLILAFKFDASSKPSLTKRHLAQVFKAIEEKWRVDSEDIISTEMDVYAALKFHLHVELNDLSRYLQQLEDS